MCGILGVYREEGVTKNDLMDLLGLVVLNSTRGPISYGIVSETKLIKSTEKPEVIDFELLELCLPTKYILVHLRAPTGDGVNNLELTQPFVFDNKILLFNGILTSWDSTKYKNDTYEVFEKFNQNKIEELKGSFACCWFKNNRMFLVRCINSLHYSNNFFSSEPFKGSKKLLHGQILDFQSKLIERFDAYTPYSIPSD